MVPGCIKNCVYIRDKIPTYSSRAVLHHGHKHRLVRQRECTLAHLRDTAYPGELRSPWHICSLAYSAQLQ